MLEMNPHLMTESTTNTTDKKLLNIQNVQTNVKNKQIPTKGQQIAALTIKRYREIIQMSEDIRINSSRKDMTREKADEETAQKLGLNVWIIQKIRAILNSYQQESETGRLCIEKMLQQGKAISTVKRFCFNLKKCSDKDKQLYLEDKISDKELCGIVENTAKTTAVHFNSVDEVIISMSDRTADSYSLADTAKLLKRGVDHLDGTIETLLTDKYLKTFSGNDLQSRTVIRDCCDHLNEIAKVIASLL